jgi:hypothetical protein
MRFSTILKSGLLLGAAVIALGFSACSDDEPTSPINPGTSTITVFHANYDYTSSVNFKVGTTAVASSVSYGSAVQGPATNGNTNVVIQALGGTPLANTTVQIDSTRSVWVILAGEGQTSEAIGITGPKPSMPTAGSANLRVIHASKNGPPMDVRIGAPNGSTLATDVVYKDAEPLAFAAVPIATTTNLYLMKKGLATMADTIAVVPVTLEDMKTYSLIVYGSSNAGADPSVKLTTRLVAEP